MLQQMYERSNVRGQVVGLIFALQAKGFVISKKERA